ncbi:hypothetical protein R3W88_009657 [Solanum pinnatisectum]|uniref:Transcription factor n=1 Tax=Solanum pinnatisectum TaxID=50273 RepID=A0AAV9MC22_9SOLN|nr:hypothetical protein R3W88_009657 [Solanum pinnatisectum]
MGLKKRLGGNLVMKTTKRSRGKKRRSRMGYYHDFNDNNNNIDLQHQQDKVVKLQRLIPGASQLPSHQLLLQTAKYIMHLRLQIHALQALVLSINTSS